MSDWFYVQNGEQKGPITEDALKRLIELSTIPQDSLIWTEGLNDWTPADQAAKLLSKKSFNVGQVRPWVRFFARMIDYSIVNIFVMMMLKRLTTTYASIIAALIAPVVLLVYAFIETGMLNTFQTTPGKAMLKVTLKGAGGRPLTPEQCLNRSLRVWAFGEGLGIPMISFYANIIAYFKLTANGTTSWDEAAEVEVTHEDLGVPRIVATAALLIFLNLILK